MSEKQDYYLRTYGMSFYTYLKLCEPCKDRWYVEGIKTLEDVEWYKETPAKEIVGEEAVRKLVQKLNLC